MTQPVDGAKDFLGRSFSNICGWLPSNTEIPLGSRVLISGGRHADTFDKFYKGREGVVVANITKPGKWPDYSVSIRLVNPVNQRETWDNYCKFRREYVTVISVGDGTVLPGVDYRLTDKERFDTVFAQRNTVFEGYCNQPTFVAAILLRQDRSHQMALSHLVRKDGSINAERVRKYFMRQIGYQELSECAWYPDGVPEWSDYRLDVNWQEIADEFALLFAEQARYEKMAA